MRENGTLKQKHENAAEQLNQYPVQRVDSLKILARGLAVHRNSVDCANKIQGNSNKENKR